MYHHFDTQIQACINEGSMSCSVPALEIQIFTLAAVEKNTDSIKPRHGNVIVFDMKHPFEMDT